MIVIVDFGMGNVGSISNMLAHIGARAEVTRDPARIAQAERLVLPGVGAFDQGMRELRATGLIDLLHRRALHEGVPTLGICLGMQLMTRASEEGSEPGLGWIDAATVRFRPPPESRLRVPQMGWNEVVPAAGSSLFADMPAAPRFYFVHSYHVVCDRPQDILATARYGEVFCAAFQVGSIVGVQFHPEKSHRFGMRLLANFCGIR